MVLPVWLAEMEWTESSGILAINYCSPFGCDKRTHSSLTDYIPLKNVKECI